MSKYPTPRVVDRSFFPPDRSNRGANTLVRAATVFLLQNRTRLATPSKDILRTYYPEDKGVEWLTRATTAPATETNADWARDLVGLGVADFINTLSPSYASATLLARGIQLSFTGGYGKIRVPSFVSDANNAAFIEENKPIPVLQFDASGGLELSPKKFATLTAFSRKRFNIRSRVLKR